MEQDSMTPLYRIDSLIRLGKPTWKIVAANNAINATELHFWVALEAPTRLEMESWDAAKELGKLIAETSRWPGLSQLYSPVINVEMQGSTPVIWWDDTADGKEADRKSVV